MKPLLLQVRGAEPEEEGESSEEVWRRRHRGARSLPPCFLSPLQGGAGAFLPHLKGLREASAPGLGEVEGGGARALWKAMFSGNKKEKRWSRTLPPGAERVRKEATHQRRASGDDVTNRYAEPE